MSKRLASSAGMSSSPSSQIASAMHAPAAGLAAYLSIYMATGYSMALSAASSKITAEAMKQASVTLQLFSRAQRNVAMKRTNIMSRRAIPLC